MQEPEQIPISEMTESMLGELEDWYMSCIKQFAERKKALNEEKCKRMEIRKAKELAVLEEQRRDIQTSIAENKTEIIKIRQYITGHENEIKEQQSQLKRLEADRCKYIGHRWDYDFDHPTPEEHCVVCGTWRKD